MKDSRNFVAIPEGIPFVCQTPLHTPSSSHTGRPRLSVNEFHQFGRGNGNDVRTCSPANESKQPFSPTPQVRSILGETPVLTDCRQLGEAMPADFKPGASVTVLGKGEQGAVTFHPESLAYSVRLGELLPLPAFGKALSETAGIQMLRTYLAEIRTCCVCHSLRCLYAEKKRRGPRSQR